MMLATVVIDFTTISVVSCSNDVMKGDDADVAVASPIITTTTATITRKAAFNGDNTGLQ